MSTLQEEPSSLTGLYKFIRRPDLSPSLRMKLGVLLVCFSYHGQVTEYSTKYKVSRSFLYGIKGVMLNHLNGLFEEDRGLPFGTTNPRQDLYKWILQLRLLGKCSLSSISELLSVINPSLANSTCFISQFLKKLGGCLGKECLECRTPIQQLKLANTKNAAINIS